MYLQTDKDDLEVTKTAHKKSAENNVNMITEQVIDNITYLKDYQILSWDEQDDVQAIEKSTRQLDYKFLNYKCIKVAY